MHANAGVGSIAHAWESVCMEFYVTFHVSALGALGREI